MDRLKNDEIDSAEFRIDAQSAGAVKRANWKTLKEDLALGGDLEVAGRYLEKQDKRKEPEPEPTITIREAKTKVFR